MKVLTLFIATFFLLGTGYAQKNSAFRIQNSKQNRLNKNFGLPVGFKSVDPSSPTPAGMVKVTLTADDVWGNGTGYQMLLDADATAYGTVILRYIL